jgi:predicted ATPase
MRRDPDRWGDGFPFDVPAVAAVDRVHFDAAPVTLLAGDNGTGKSVHVHRGGRQRSPYCSTA